MRYWERHFNIRAEKWGSSFRADDHLDFLSFLATQLSLKKIARDWENRLVLDVGCGNGVLTSFLLPGNRVIGIDISQSMLLLAREKGFQVLRGEANHLPFTSGIFDVVLGIGILQYLDDEKGALEEMVRVLKRGGEIIISFLHKNSFLRRVKKEKLPLKLYERNEIITLLRRLEIKDITLFSLSYPFPFPFSYLPPFFTTTYFLRGRKW